jgi:hypothetical protein
MGAADDKEYARRIAAMDQARAGIVDLSTVAATFYAGLRKHGIPRSLAAQLTMIAVDKLMPDGS